jgi:hypothetical protein
MHVYILLLYYCVLLLRFTTALLLYGREQRLRTRPRPVRACGADLCTYIYIYSALICVPTALLLLYYWFTTDLLLIYYWFTTDLLLLYYCRPYANLWMTSTLTARYRVYLLYSRTKVQILTPEERQRSVMIVTVLTPWGASALRYLLYWYKSTNTDTLGAFSATLWLSTPA